MREQAPDVSIRSEIEFEDDLMRRLVEGALDLALMYTPQHSPGLHVEHLFDETLVMLGTDPQQHRPGEGYVYVDWGPAFYAQHSASYPDMERPAQIANIGWLGLQLILANGGACFVPEHMAAPYVESGRLFLAPNSPRFKLPAYVVYPLENELPVLHSAIRTLRDFVASSPAQGGGAAGEADRP